MGGEGEFGGAGAKGTGVTKANCFITVLNWYADLTRRVFGSCCFFFFLNNSCTQPKVHLCAHRVDVSEAWWSARGGWSLDTLKVHHLRNTISCWCQCLSDVSLHTLDSQFALCLQPLGENKALLDIQQVWNA